MSQKLEEMGYRMYRGARASSIIGLKNAVEEYITNIDNSPSITKIANKYKIGKKVLSNRLKELGIEVINYQNIVTYNEHIFDSIDTEEKAYWLGFIYADGYISSSQNTFELSLKADDSSHLKKFSTFMQETRKDKVKINDVTCNDIVCKRCRWGSSSAHLHNTLNKLGCVPNKSLVLKFPNEDIFADKSLIRHFIRGYWDGDGCLSWGDKEHNIPCISVIGTEDFLTGIMKNIPIQHFYTLQKANPYSNNEITKQFAITGKNGYLITKYLYSDSTVYLDRKYEKYLEYCRLYEESYRESETKIGEGCDVNPEVIIETKESVTP